MAETKSQQSRPPGELMRYLAAFCGLYLLIRRGIGWYAWRSWYYPIAGLVMLA
ncbi:hypothetical protein LAD77_29945 [Klebsiella pneumoniae]|nr:hypothetical protein [Klebsiella pneumoniae]